jgi:CDGSH-type Zn-finger protein
MRRTVADLKKLIGTCNHAVIGDSQRAFLRVEPIHGATGGALTFCVNRGEEAIRLPKETNASVVICDARAGTRKSWCEGKHEEIVGSSTMKKSI